MVFLRKSFVALHFNDDTEFMSLPFTAEMKGLLTARKKIRQIVIKQLQESRKKSNNLAFRSQFD